jgi:hypothetical protein
MNDNFVEILPMQFNVSLTLALVMTALQGIAHAEGKFEKLGVYLEYTVEDQDSEVLFEAIGGDVGMATLKVVAPDGRTVVDFKAPDSKQGVRHVVLESPEPKDKEAIRKDFPEGSYRFIAGTTSGATLQGEARLSHKLPEAAALVQPQSDASNVPVKGMQIRWRPVKNIAKWLVVIEHEASGDQFKVNLPAAATSFAVPDGFLAPGRKYKLGISAVASDGNSTVSEADFATVASK